MKLEGAKLTVDTYEYKVQLKVNEVTGVKTVVLFDGFMPYEGKYVIYEGKEALEFSVLFDKFYAYLDGTTPVLVKAESSLPPVPPPPPPLPF